MLNIDRELFQWEKDRYVSIDYPHQITHVQFYNDRIKEGPEVAVINSTALIPNYLLKETLPIIALGYIKTKNDTKIVCRKVFRVLKRARPQSYIDDSSEVREIIYDGGVEV